MSSSSSSSGGLWLDEKSYEVAPSGGGFPVAKDGLLVIGAGLGRTGTESLQAALQILLNAPCYHMSEVLKHKESHLWIPKDGQIDFQRIFTKRADGIRYRACVDYPAAAYVPELMKLNPEALVLLSKRKSAEDWAASSEATIWRATKIFLLLNLFTFALIPFVRNSTMMISSMVQRTLGFCPSINNLTHENLIAGYEKHNAEIERLVPKDRLLIYTVGDGWEPICKALKLPIPSIPYPHKNAKENFMRKFWDIVYRQLLGGHKGLVVIVLGVVAAAFFFSR